MNDLELIFTMLGEASTTKITRSKNAQGFVENKSVAKKGGKIVIPFANDDQLKKIYARLEKVENPAK